MPFADVPNGMRIYYEEYGSGEPVLLLMGTGADHTFWGPQIPAYSERHRTIIVDSRGTGQSTRPDDPTTCTAAGPSCLTGLKTALWSNVSLTRWGAMPYLSTITIAA